MHHLACGLSLPIIKLSSRSPESKNNFPNFQNVDGIILIIFSPTFLVFRGDIFLKVTKKASGSRDLTFPLFALYNV